MPDRAATCSRKGLLPLRFREKNAAHLSKVSALPTHDELLELSPAPQTLSDAEDDEQKGAFCSLISTMFYAQQSTVVYLLLRLETQYPVQLEVPENLLDRLERFKMALETTTISNQPAV